MTPLPFVSVSQGMSGYYAVLMTWSDGMYQPWNTGIGRYATREEAALEAMEWAKCENLEFKA